MKVNWLAGGSALAIALALSNAPAKAADIETRGEYCNDNYFTSDGAGLSACLNFALRYKMDIIGIGLTGATPEQRGNVKGDPLDEVSRITAWYGREFEGQTFRYALVARAGIEGGTADDLSISLRDGLHDVFGAGAKDLGSTRPTTLIAGASSWARTDYALGETTGWHGNFSPYGHAALGNDVMEGGLGMMLALQPADVSEGLALVLPKNGAYAPTFGGDGIGLFAGVRFVAMESLYEDLANPFVAEAGIAGQVTLWDFAVMGASASCTTEPYDGADKADCKATFALGGLF